ncbi:hypothetical protein TcasGA2_TC001331 [Tribolium castaneum]|uniref:Uncharacterized protein n=1 Tax=Tribolium castaneum TaxID=7070 RepID=D6WC64_TRICA|nr:hypothetical protein TcasGA2_TC001331 [Tribolium castaneum]
MAEERRYFQKRAYFYMQFVWCLAQLDIIVIGRKWPRVITNSPRWRGRMTVGTRQLTRDKVIMNSVDAKENEDASGVISTGRPFTAGICSGTDLRRLLLELLPTSFYIYVKRWLIFLALFHQFDRAECEKQEVKENCSMSSLLSITARNKKKLTFSTPIPSYDNTPSIN